MTAVRAAAPADVGAMADVAELRRAEYARWEPDFWRPSPTARLAHMPYLSWLVEHESTVALVAESDHALDGFLVMRRREPVPGLSQTAPVCEVDDFAVRRRGDWPEAGRALLDAALGYADHDGPSAVLAVCGRADRAKAAVLRAGGLQPACSLRLHLLGAMRRDAIAGVRPAGPGDADTIAALAACIPEHIHGMQTIWSEPRSPAGYREHLGDAELLGLAIERDGELVGYALGRPGVPPPPVYDPAGSTCVVDELALAPDADWATTGARLLDALEAEAARRGDTQLLVSCARLEREKRALLDARGYHLPVDWFSRLPRS